MIGDNIKHLRIRHQLTQEQVAEHVNVSRQAVAKWEKGESIPDISSCTALAKLFQVTLDNLVNFDDSELGIGLPPKGKHFFGTVKMGERGQIVIPKKARDVFRLNAGDTLIIVGDEERGLAIVPEEQMSNFFTLVKTPLDDDSG
ncbi:helix-turn-helix domain-containing protein [Paenibacillus septentrionalis]|uniref:Helix-turn-helix domain-containing protein n=2 Tax=Paenibacillus septentrionalis TaxID=429342 RepID=A0ABW1V770_9BACL